MDYKQKYEEALERATKIHSKERITEIELVTCEEIFPELCESEDEKIRKEIINYIKNSTCQVGDKTYNSWIAWLEKQGEQKPIIIIPQFNVGDTIKPKTYNEEHLIKDINENGYVLDVDIIIPFKDEDVWEIVEQNTAWSKEDERMYQSILDDTVQKYLLDGNQFAWLKSLKDRVQPQPKQEWSEEDEKTMDFIINILKCAPDMRPCSEIYHELAYQKQINWLKSLRPQPHWKPSEQNIKDLEWCAGLVQDKMGVGFHRLQVFIDEIKNL